jgi:RNA recognition motif-containing protein
MARLFVGNLPYSASEADIQNFFSDAGFPVDTVDVMRDKFTGDARGFGFVEIADADTAARAVDALNGKELSGRNLVVNEARPMNREGGAGGRRGPGSAGGGGRQRDFGGGSSRW